MPAVTELEIFTAVRTNVLAAGGWFASESMKVHFGRRPPNAQAEDGSPVPLMEIAVEEQEDAETESDGATAQRFLVEMRVRSVGPNDAAAMTAAIVALDPRWTAAHGLTIADTDKGIMGVAPKAGKLRLLEPLIAGADQYTAQRRWEIHTAAMIGVTP